MTTFFPNFKIECCITGPAVIFSQLLSLSLPLYLCLSVCNRACTFDLLQVLAADRAMLREELSTANQQLSDITQQLDDAETQQHQYCATAEELYNTASAFMAERDEVQADCKQLREALVTAQATLNALARGQPGWGVPNELSVLTKAEGPNSGNGGGGGGGWTGPSATAAVDRARLPARPYLAKVATTVAGGFARLSPPGSPKAAAPAPAAAAAAGTGMLKRSGSSSSLLNSGISYSISINAGERRASLTSINTGSPTATGLSRIPTIGACTAISALNSIEISAPGAFGGGGGGGGGGFTATTAARSAPASTTASPLVTQAAAVGAAAGGCGTPGVQAGTGSSPGSPARTSRTSILNSPEPGECATGQQSRIPSLGGIPLGLKSCIPGLPAGYGASAFSNPFGGGTSRATTACSSAANSPRAYQTGASTGGLLGAAAQAAAAAQVAAAAAAAAAAAVAAAQPGTSSLNYMSGGQQQQCQSPRGTGGSRGASRRQSAHEATAAAAAASAAATGVRLQLAGVGGGYPTAIVSPFAASSGRGFAGRSPSGRLGGESILSTVREYTSTAAAAAAGDGNGGGGRTPRSAMSSRANSSKSLIPTPGKITPRRSCDTDDKAVESRQQTPRRAPSAETYTIGVGRQQQPQQQQQQQKKLLERQDVLVVVPDGSGGGWSGEAAVDPFPSTRASLVVPDLL